MSLQRFQQYIDGAFVDASDTFESKDPATEEAWAIMPAASEEDVNRAVGAARRPISPSPIISATQAKAAAVCGR